ncbi:MAG: hypothetical protein A2632_01935 [Candidatus Pacebacteria bacterium RIFCSPHIGHO2_01_FULL_46_16]|nr:MAG: hypothetical protein A2632_01935 [Candidatus Pacebacteria bacterium RIFCSPHIGHO2_01_FULL_46_16]OGJ20675.1 MAG: hypothetical protein A3J60_00630 [Candidatus Pacebacteria bacterium RIFCSPHIGHO2_02_FULL_46_9]
MSSEKQLIEKLKRGEAAAVREWFARYHDKLVDYVARRLANQADAEELVQEAFIHALKQLPLFRGSSSLWTWLVAIARHEIADYYRKHYAKKMLKLVPLFETLLTEPIADTSEVSSVVFACLEQMHVYSAELLRLKYIDNKQVAEIAVELGKSLKAVESELFRARGEFKAVYALVLQERAT